VHRADLDVVPGVVKRVRHVPLSRAHPAGDENHRLPDPVHAAEDHPAVLFAAGGFVERGEAQKRHVKRVGVDVFPHLVHVGLSRRHRFHHRVRTGVPAFRIGLRPLVPHLDGLLAPADDRLVARPQPQEDHGFQDQGALAAVVAVAGESPHEREAPLSHAPRAHDEISEPLRRLEGLFRAQEFVADQEAVDQEIPFVKLHAPDGRPVPRGGHAQVAIGFLAPCQLVDCLEYPLRQLVVAADHRSVGCCIQPLAGLLPDPKPFLVRLSLIEGDEVLHERPVLEAPLLVVMEPLAQKAADPLNGVGRDVGEVHHRSLLKPVKISRLRLRGRFRRPGDDHFLLPAAREVVPVVAQEPQRGADGDRRPGPVHTPAQAIG